jgi:2-polyprenyl-6-methoxyphenol hydroxylase-like FAD-dependent oxidoreductase
VLEELDRMGPGGGITVDRIQHFSLHSGRNMGSVDFAGKDGTGYGGYKGRRMMRISLLLAMIACVEKSPHIDIQYGKKVVGGTETKSGITIFFEDGTNVTGDIALGCDGVHSYTRTKFVDPDRPSQYTGISFVQTTLRADKIESTVHFDATAMNQSRQGSVLTTFCDGNKEDIFVAALAEIDAEHLEKLMWKREGGNWRPQLTSMRILKGEMQRRFGDCSIPCVREMIDKGSEWLLYPVYEVAPNGRWFTERVLLLGDAAHAVRSPRLN